MSKQILFIDDEPEFINQHKSALSRAGFAVVEALTYEEACEKLKTQQFDLIVLDLIISSDGELVNADESEPDVEVGLRLHKQIREELKFSRIPILFFSVVNDSSVFQHIQLIEKKMGRSTINYLPKPQLPSKLVSVIRDLLN